MGGGGRPPSPPASYAYDDGYCGNLPKEVELGILSMAWSTRKRKPQFLYCSLTMKFQLTILIFVRSLREGKFQMYIEACSALAPWFFALNHTNYARWLPVHIRDMVSLEKEIPSLAAEFQSGHFVVQKSHRAFSSIAIDQAHEQNNKIIKGDGGAVGLTENPSQLLRWMVSGPEVARVIDEFKSSEEQTKKQQSEGPDFRHHEILGFRQHFRGR